MDSIFTKIIKKEIPSYKIAEDDKFYAFLDINPNTRGHTLVVPKLEEDKIFDLNIEQYNNLMSFSYRVAKAIEKTIDCKRVGMTVIGIDVPHVHVHLIPINNIADMQFIKKEKLFEKEFLEISEAISNNFFNFGYLLFFISMVF